VTENDIAGLAAEYHRQGWWRDRTLLEDFAEHARRQPGKVAVISDHIDRPREQHTFGELATIVDQVAAGLLELGVQPGDIVSCQLPN
jgi:cyclohexanecarboxylate-CoA ligase